MTGRPPAATIDRVEGLPVPSLVVLVGPVGAGKHEWAARHFAPNEIASLDLMRAAVGADENDAAATRDATRLLDEIVSVRVGRGLTAVIVTEGLERARRKVWLDAAPAETPRYAFLFTTSLERCIERDRQSARPTAHSFIKRQALRTLEIGPELTDEGFDVFLVRDPDD